MVFEQEMLTQLQSWTYISVFEVYMLSNNDSGAIHFIGMRLLLVLM